jgi:hypothetical protein
MNMELILGLLVTAVPAIAIGYFMLSKQPGIFRMFVAMVLIGLGYLTATGAINEIGTKVLSGTYGAPTHVPEASPVTTAPAPAPGY